LYCSQADLSLSFDSFPQEALCDEVFSLPKLCCLHKKAQSRAGNGQVNKWMVQIQCRKVERVYS